MDRNKVHFKVTKRILVNSENAYYSFRKLLSRIVSLGYAKQYL
jgi:hypothetical protein